MMNDGLKEISFKEVYMRSAGTEFYVKCPDVDFMYRCIILTRIPRRKAIFCDCYNEKLEKWFRREFSIEEKNTYYFDFDHPYNIHRIFPDFS